MGLNYSTNPGRGNTKRRILAAVDTSENSKQTVMYMADFFGGRKDILVTLLSIISEPSKDYFATDEQRLVWISETEIEIRNIMNNFKEILLAADFSEQQIDIKISLRRSETIAEEILKEQEKLPGNIIVIGRRGLAHTEELGSTAMAILHGARNCAVMVVE